MDLTIKVGLSRSRLTLLRLSVRVKFDLGIAENAHASVKLGDVQQLDLVLRKSFPSTRTALIIGSGVRTARGQPRSNHGTVP